MALESTIISHGLPTATSAATAREIEAAVRSGGAVPATVALVDGAVRVGLTDDDLVRVAEGPDVVKTSVRDLGPVLARQADRGDDGGGHGVRRGPGRDPAVRDRRARRGAPRAPVTPGTSRPTSPRSARSR